MKNTRLHQSSLWSRLLDSNPQLFREIKGKLKTRNVVIAAAVAVIAQFISVIYSLGQLPDTDKTLRCGRYGLTLLYNETRHGSRCYEINDYTKWAINWQLWWLDLFLTLSFIAVIALLVIGTYMLVADMVKESERGTLNFIRLSPQSAGSILAGKIIGVPILLYTAIAFLLPLHLTAGLQAHIPLSLVLTFDLTVVASCCFFYSVALFWSLLPLPSGLKPWLASGCLAWLVMLSSTVLFNHHLDFDYFAAWALLFHPGVVLAYLVNASQLKFGSVNFLSVDNLAELSFYGREIGNNAVIGIGLILGNFGLWTYWCWSVLQRRFQNPEQTILSKGHSYWLTGWFVTIALGFTLQQSNDGTLRNFYMLQVCLSIFGLCLIAALSPQRQALHNWMRYRHQKSRHSLWYELVLGENSPSTVAIAINMAIAIAFITPSIFSILDPQQRYIFWSLLLSATSIMLVAVVVQIILTSKTRKRVALSTATVAAMMIIPPLCLGVAELTVRSAPTPWLFTFFTSGAVQYAADSSILLAIAGQWLAIALVSLQMTRKLKLAGASETRKMIAER